MLGALDRAKYEVIPVGITREGAFVLASDDPADYRLDPERLPAVVDNGTRVLWPESAVSHEVTVRDGSGEVRSLGVVDVVFPILHGPWGEDGTLQGMLELVGLPYVGSGVLASALGMDKHFSKTVFTQAGLPVAAWRTVTAAEWARDPSGVAAAAERLGYPVFVKPARAGSSVGVSKATDASGLGAALDVAFREDSKVLVEATLVGREIEIGVLGGRDGGPTRASVAGEVVISGDGFYDFASKYLGAPGIDLVCPAELSAEQLSEMQSLAIRAFDSIGGEGLARVDFFLTADGWVINEINTMPGFTPISMFPRCWQASGFSYPELLDELIALGLARG